MSDNKVILRFDTVSFNFGEKKPILIESSFSLRKGSKVTIMGQNGAGKSTIIGLILEKFKPKEGRISKDAGLTVGHAKQVVAEDEKEMTVRDYFARAFVEKKYDLDVKIANVLEIVNFKNCDYDKKIKQFSGGQQARLLLAFAIIGDPDILLLDEPTNNLDTEGIEHLTGYLMMSEKTCVVISHDADFLNAFTDNVWYLDVYKHQVEMYQGNYYDVVEQIQQQIDRENRQNARMQKEIQEKKDKINFFAHKGGKMRKLASKLRDDVAEAEEGKVEVRKEDKTIRDFSIPSQQELSGALLEMEYIPIISEGEPIKVKANIELRKNIHLHLKGPNGIGKTTLLEAIVNEKVEGMQVFKGLKIGYYRQDFSNLKFDKTVRESLLEMGHKEEYMRQVAAGFLIGSDIINHKIGDLSEGQKGLVAFSHLVLQEPGLLILDEPTNHINFRHLPVIAKALDQFDGAMLVVSHSEEFVSQINFHGLIDLQKLKDKNGVG
jgi:ATPase subunit of ABC transporter with duplicated ATPase domains